MILDGLGRVCRAILDGIGRVTRPSDVYSFESELQIEIDSSTPMNTQIDVDSRITKDVSLDSPILEIP
jgi:hypothetical protein